MSQQEITRVIYRKIKDSITDRNVDVGVVFDICVAAMRLVERTHNLDGNDKKEIVKQTVRMVVDDLDVPADNRDLINMLVDVIVPVAIDLIIAGENGALKIVKKSFARCI